MAAAAAPLHHAHAACMGSIMSKMVSRRPSVVLGQSATVGNESKRVSSLQRKIHNSMKKDRIDHPN